MLLDSLDQIRELFRAFNAADAGLLESAYAPDAVMDGVFLAPDRPAPVTGRAEMGQALRAFFARFAPALDGAMFVRVRTLARLETGRGWVHAEWVAGLRERESEHVHHLTGYTHFYVGKTGLIEQQRTVVQAAVADSAAGPPSLPHPAPHGSRRYPSRPIVGVGAVIFVGGRVVLIKRRFEPLAGQWSLPGGTLEVGETLEAGAAREILEETGLAVDVGPVIEVFDRIVLDESRKVVYHFVLVDYLCRPIGGELQHGSDVADVTLADPDALDAYGLLPKAASIIRKGAEMLRQGPWPGREEQL